MSEKPLVSVIMNCRNSEAYLRDAISSVYAQTYPNWEIIFWDNQSTDNSAGIAQSYDERVRYFRGTESLSLGEARNRAVQKAGGEYLAILDCDDIWEPEKLAAQVAVAQANPEAAVIYSNCEIIDSEGRFLGKLLHPTQFYRGEVFEALLLYKFFPPWPTVMLRTSAYEKFEAYKIVEDWDILLRMAHRFPFEYVEESLAKYRTHPQNGSRNQVEVILQEQLAICEFWASRNIQPAIQPGLLGRARARSYLTAATGALYNGSDISLVRHYLKQSLKESPSPSACAYFLISMIGANRARGFLGYLRSRLGYSQNLNVAPADLSNQLRSA